MGIGKKKKQKWQYNENALRICKKRTANLENVKNAFREKGKRKANRNKTIKVSFIPKGKLENGYRKEKEAKMAI